MQSLKDKLLKAGLVSEDAAKKAETQAPAPRQHQARPPPPARTQARPRPPPLSEPAPSRLPRFAPLPGSAAAAREASKKQLELDRKIREKVMASQVLIDDGATPFYFVTRKNKLRRLTLTQPQADRIRTGELAIVERPDPDKIDYALVPPEVAKELMQLSSKTVRFLNAGADSVGFVSDEDLERRASEADAPDDGAEEAQATEPAPATEPEGEQTWVAIKRAPLAPGQ